MGFQTGTILKAISSLLLSDSTLLALTSNIYVLRLPKTKSYPAVVIGDRGLNSVPFNVFGRKGRESLFSIIVYDNSRSLSKADSIAKRIDALLDETNLTISNNYHVCTQIQDDAIVIEEANAEENGMSEVRLLYKITTQES